MKQNSTLLYCSAIRFKESSLTTHPGLTFRLILQQFRIGGERGKYEGKCIVCAEFAAYLNDEIDKFQFPHLFHLEVGDKKTNIVTLQQHLHKK